MRGRSLWVGVPVAVLLFVAFTVIRRAQEVAATAVVTPPRFWAGLAASEAAVVARAVAVALLVAAVCAAVAAVVGRRTPRSRGWAAVALVGGTFALVTWFEHVLDRALVLEDVTRVGDVVRLAHLRPTAHLLATAALLCAVPALVRWRSVPVAALTAAVFVTVGCGAWATRTAFAVGPDPALASLAHVVPLHTPPQAHRVPFGCVLHRGADGAWEGESLARELPLPANGCPDPLVRGAFTPRDAPLFAVSADTPSTELAGWTSTHGDARIVVRLVEHPTHHLEAWFLSEVRVGVRQPPIEGDPSTRPLPGAVLLRKGETWDGSGPLRVELLVLPEAAPTVGDLLAVCDAATRAHPRGLVCTLAVGEAWDAWAATSRG